MRKVGTSSIPQKTNFVLRIILVALFLIIFRIWHLSMVQRDEKLLKAQNAQRKTHLVRANRGTICDRYHTPLAFNRICYNAAIYYNQISQIPISSWQADETGKKHKTFPRKEYIQKLAKLLAQELELEWQRVEDEIHAKASLFPHAPYVIKANIDEIQHYRLCQLERDWPGLHAEISSERFYPLGKVAADLIGTMGSISAKEYRAVAEEISTLESAISRFEEGFWEDFPQGYTRIEDIYRRLYELKEKAYTFNDRVGKTGIEAQFEQELRGYFGKKSIEVDQKGRFVRELPSSYPAIGGQQIVLSLSAELQQFAEELLIQNESMRDNRSLGFDPQTRQRKPLKQPWIKGGAIVAMDPNTGEILAMASYPRYDPNDFILSGQSKKEKIKQVQRWLENETFIADLWDGKRPFLRERYKKTLQEESLWITWDTYLEQILPKEGPLPEFFRRFDSIKTAIELQEDFELALYHTKQADPKIVFEQIPQLLTLLQKEDTQAFKRIRRLESAMQSLSFPQDKLFIIDLLRLAVYSASFSDELIQSVGSMKLSTYFSLHQALQVCESIAKEVAKKQFHEGPFQQWKEENQKEFLTKKRGKEKKRKTYARPYLDYLDQKEAKLFAAYWAECRLETLLNFLHGPTCPKAALKLQESLSTIPKDLQREWLKTFRSYAELNRPLLGVYKRVRKPYIEKHLASAFYPIGGFGFNRSCSFQATAPPGSIFKLVSAYTALSQQVTSFSMIDELKVDSRAPPHKREIIGYTIDHKTPYPRHYKGGRLPKSHAPNIGKIDLLGALEQSSNPYFSLLAGEFFSSAEDLFYNAKLFGFGEKTGIDLPNEAKGNLPTDLSTNRTGLYSFAIGQHTALATPLQAACMLTAIANGGRLIEPKLSTAFIGPAPDRSSLEPFCANDYFAKEELNTLGLCFSLFTGAQARAQQHRTYKHPIVVKRHIPLSPSLQNCLFEGMDRGVWGAKGSARPSISRSLAGNPRWMRDYLALQHQMIGKTSTAEIAINLNINPSSLASIYKHTSFGAIAFSSEKHKKHQPELVVVVFFRYADGGKEAAPLAAQIIHKWREIRTKRNPL